MPIKLWLYFNAGALFTCITSTGVIFWIKDQSFDWLVFWLVPPVSASQGASRELACCKYSEEDTVRPVVSRWTSRQRPLPDRNDNYSDHSKYRPHWVKQHFIHNNYQYSILRRLLKKIKIKEAKKSSINSHQWVLQCGVRRLKVHVYVEPFKCFSDACEKSGGDKHKNSGQVRFPS